VRKAVLFWMENHRWFLKHPRFFKFWEWVVMPRTWGGRLGFMNWLRWVMR
jgi:hypothetical protein